MRWFLCSARFSDNATAQSLQIANMAVPAKASDGDLSGCAAERLHEGRGVDERVIFVAPTTSIQAMLGRCALHRAGSSALVSIARGNTP
jgi:hypothetical protein